MFVIRNANMFVRLSQLKNSIKEHFFLFVLIYYYYFIISWNFLWKYKRSLKKVYIFYKVEWY